VVGLEYASNSLVMDSNKIIDKLINEDEMTEEEAQEFFDYNIAGSKGDGFPIYVYIPE
jgi:polyhydroxyalkanoate synthesis regulator phasin